MWLWSRSSPSSESEARVTVVTCLRSLPSDEVRSADCCERRVCLSVCCWGTPPENFSTTLQVFTRS